MSFRCQLIRERLLADRRRLLLALALALALALPASKPEKDKRCYSDKRNSTDYPTDDSTDSASG
jgi:hypothetical protein